MLFFEVITWLVENQGNNVLWTLFFHKDQIESFANVVIEQQCVKSLLYELGILGTSPSSFFYKVTI